MKFILFLMIVYGTADNNLATLVRGPAYSDNAACRAAGDSVEVKSQIPIVSVRWSCDPEKQAKE